VAQVAFERQTLRPGLVFKGKGLPKPVAFKLRVSRVPLAPPHRVQEAVRKLVVERRGVEVRVVAVQVDPFESKGFETRKSHFRLKG
jgi:hypothetical protein